MADFHSNPFSLLSEDYKAPEPTQKKKSVVVRGAQKKPIFPGETPKKKKTKTPAKQTSAPKSTGSTAPSVKSSPLQTGISYELLHSSARAFLTGVDEALNSHSVLFKIVLPEKSPLSLKEKPYKTLEEIIKNEAYGNALI